MIFFQPPKVIERSPTPELDPTVESGVEDLNRIRIDDIDETLEIVKPQQQIDENSSNSGKSKDSASSGSDDSANKSSESFAETLSADNSAASFKEDIQPEESEQKIIDLISESKWMEAVKAYRYEFFVKTGKKQSSSQNFSRFSNFEVQVYDIFSSH